MGALISLETIRKYCEGKSVILVGNGECILNNNSHGDIIESKDIVVRMNHGVPTTEIEKNVGHRTDLWICAFNSKPKQVTEYYVFNPDYVIRLNNDMIDDELNNITYIWNDYHYKVFKDSLGVLPTTGVTALYFFNEFIKPSELNIIGFDNFETNVFYSDKDFISICKKYHNPEFEKVWMEEYLEKNDHINIYK